MFSITDIARDKIKEVLKENPDKYLRVVIEGCGWGGPQLGLVLDEPEGKETPTKINNIDVLLSEEVKRIADKSVVDYVVSPYGEGFAVRSDRSACE